VRAGAWASTVPDLLVAEGRYGVALGEPVEHARAELEQAVAEACAGDPWLREHPVEVEWWGGQFASGRLPAGHPFAEQVRTAHRATTGREAEVTGVTYGSDLRLLSGIGGIPTLIYGPGDVRVAHSPDEQVPVAEMVDVTRTLVLLAAQFCGTDDRSGVVSR
jgi:acetylornithine deacetylase